VNEQQIEKGHYFFEHRQNRSTIIVFFGTAHKLKFSEIELLLRVFDHLPPPGFGGHVSTNARRNKPRKDDVFDAFRVCGIFGHAKSTIVLDFLRFVWKIAVGLRRVREIRPAVAPSLAQKGLKHEREYEIEDFWHASRSPLKKRRVFT